MTLLLGLAEAQQPKPQTTQAANTQTNSPAESASGQRAPTLVPSRPLTTTPTQPKAPEIVTSKGHDPRKPTANPKPFGLVDEIQVGSAVISVVATVALAIFAAIQISVYRGQTKIMLSTLRANARAVRASQRSAKAAEDAVAKSDEILAHAQKSSQMELRAYVFLEEIELKLTLGSANVQLKFKNAGKTPAYNMKIYGSIAKAFWPIGDTLSISKESPEISDEPVGPDMLRFKYETSPMNQIETNALHAGTTALVVWGEVEYRDAFDQLRRTRYRYFCGGAAGMRPISDQNGAFHGVYGMSAHKYGNDSD